MSTSENVHVYAHTTINTYTVDIFNVRQHTTHTPHTAWTIRRTPRPSKQSTKSRDHEITRFLCRRARQREGPTSRISFFFLRSKVDWLVCATPATISSNWSASTASCACPDRLLAFWVTKTPSSLFPIVGWCIYLQRVRCLLSVCRSCVMWMRSDASWFVCCASCVPPGMC